MIKHRGYYITPAKQSPNLYYIATEGKGGKIPNCLTGLYTKTMAIREIDKYVEVKEKGDAKNTDQSGD